MGDGVENHPGWTFCDDERGNYNDNNDNNDGNNDDNNNNDDSYDDNDDGQNNHDYHDVEMQRQFASHICMNFRWWMHLICALRVFGRGFV